MPLGGGQTVSKTVSFRIEGPWSSKSCAAHEVCGSGLGEMVPGGMHPEMPEDSSLPGLVQYLDGTAISPAAPNPLVGDLDAEEVESGRCFKTVEAVGGGAVAVVNLAFSTAVLYASLILSRTRLQCCNTCVADTVT